MKHKIFYKSISIIVIFSLLLSGCKKESKDTGYTIDNLGTNDTFVIEKDGYADQPYWNYMNRPFAKAENGYYFLDTFYLKYIDKETMKVHRLCSDPLCICRNPLSIEEEKEMKKNGIEIPKCKADFRSSNMIYYHNGLLYSFECDEETNMVYLISISIDGLGTIKRICEVCPNDNDYYGAMRMIIHGNNMYVYDWTEAMENGEKTITRYSLDGKDKKVIARFKGSLVHFTSVKSYGSKLFYIVEERTDKNDLTKMCSEGVYVYDYNTEETVRILTKNVNDFAVDEENNLIYYYITGDGLYKKPLDKKGTEGSIKLCNATDETYFCDLSYDGTYLYMNNEKFAWRSLSKLWPYTLVLDADGTIINKINEINFPIFGDETYTFINNAYQQVGDNPDNDIKYIEKSQVPTATYDDFKSLQYATEGN